MPGAPVSGNIGLCLAGGGARGAYQAGVLRAVGQLTGSGANPFSAITGVSVGAVNAAFLACRADDFAGALERLERLWCSLRPHDIYRTDAASVLLCSLHWLTTLILPRLGWQTPQSLLNMGPFEALLQREIDFGNLERVIDSGALTALAVTASSYTDGRAKTFFQGHDSLENWRRTRRDGYRTKLATEHVLASTALPLVFRSRKIGGEYFGDGALRLTMPLSPAIRLGADRILVVAARDESSESAAIVDKAPRLGDIVGYLLDVLFNDNLNADLERLQRINETLSMVAREQRRELSLREIDVHLIRPSVDIRSIAAKHADALPFTIKMLLRGIGAWGPDWRLASYLLFERDYCRELADLGYRDAMEDSETLLQFLKG